MLTIKAPTIEQALSRVYDLVERRAIDAILTRVETLIYSSADTEDLITELHALITENLQLSRRRERFRPPASYHGGRASERRPSAPWIRARWPESSVRPGPAGSECA